MARARTTEPPTIAERIGALDWLAPSASLDADGYVVVPSLLDPSECGALAESYDAAERFRSRVVMARHGYGRGEYKYFAYPLPAIVAQLRTALYPALASVANRWSEALRVAVRYPGTHASFLDCCHRAGQVKPTPLLLRYGEGDYNRLHQDLYGEHVFPLQATILLSAPGRDFSGGEFVLVEQQPRMQSRAAVVPLGHGDAVIVAVRQRPVQGARGFHRVTMRHGVSPLHSGHRMTLGIIFHDAQ